MHGHSSTWHSPHQQKKKTKQNKTKNQNPRVLWFREKVTSKITSKHKGTHVKLGYVCYSTTSSLLLVKPSFIYMKHSFALVPINTFHRITESLLSWKGLTTIMNSNPFTSYQLCTSTMQWTEWWHTAIIKRIMAMSWLLPVFQEHYLKHTLKHCPKYTIGMF